jgi:uncharacterized protein (TIGR02996 family)
MRTFQCGGESGRFWNIEAIGPRVVLRYGKVGSAGSEEEIVHDSEKAARADVERRIRKKRNAGYTETTPVAISPMQAALEDTLAAHPDDLAAHMAYADWLSEQSETNQQVRGEFIRTQLALEDPTRSPAERRRLQQHERDLLLKHSHGWMGCLGEWFNPVAAPFLRFARGWVNSVRIELLHVNLARCLASAPQLRLLRELTILSDTRGRVSGLDVPDDLLYPGLAALRWARYFGNVETFTLGDLDGDSGFRTFPDGLYLQHLLERMPRLRELNVNSGGVDGDLSFFELLAERQLHTLRLERARLSDEGVRRLVRSGLLAHLKVLQMWNARFTDDGARSLARNKAQLRKMALLDVSFNWLTEEGIELLRKTGVTLVADYQMTPSDDHDDYEFDDEDSDDEFEITLDEFDEDWE